MTTASKAFLWKQRQGPILCPHRSEGWGFEPQWAWAAAPTQMPFLRARGEAHGGAGHRCPALGLCRPPAPKLVLSQPQPQGPIGQKGSGLPRPLLAVLAPPQLLAWAHSHSDEGRERPAGHPFCSEEKAFMGLHVCLDGRRHSPPPAPGLWSPCPRRLPLTPCDCPQGQRVGRRALPTGA